MTSLVSTTSDGYQMRDQHVSIRATILQKKKPAALDVIKNDKPADLALYHILIFSLLG